MKPSTIRTLLISSYIIMVVIILFTTKFIYNYSENVITKYQHISENTTRKISNLAEIRRNVFAIELLFNTQIQSISEAEKNNCKLQSMHAVSLIDDSIINYIKIANNPREQFLINDFNYKRIQNSALIDSILHVKSRVGEEKYLNLGYKKQVFDQLEKTISQLINYSRVELLTKNKEVSWYVERATKNLYIMLTTVLIVLLLYGWIIYRTINRLKTDNRALNIKQIEIFDEKERLRVMLQSIGDAVIATDREGKVILMNSIAEQLTGWKFQEAYNQPLIKVFNIINEITGIQCANPVELVLLKGQAVGLANHTMLLSKDGNRYIIADSGSPIRNVDGEITGVILVFRDDTEKHRAEQQLKESEERYRNFIEQSKELIYSVDLKGNLLFTNEAWRNAHGYLKSEVEKLNIFDVVSPEYINDCKTVFEKVIQGNFVENINVVFLSKSGRKITVEGNTSPRYINDKIIGTQAFFKDVTERNARETELRESEEKYKAMFESAHDAIILFTADKFIDCNIMALKMFNITNKSELIRYNPADFSPPSQPDGTPSYIASTEHLHKVLLMGYHHFEWSYKRLNGEVFPTDVLLTQISFKGERIFLSTIRDISEKKQAEIKLLKSERMLYKITSSIPGVVFQITMNSLDEYNFTFISEGVKRVLGSDAETIINDSNAAFFYMHLEDAPRLKQCFRESSAILSPVLYDFRVQLPGEKERWIRAESIPEQQLDGSIVWNGTFFDLTSIKNYEADLQIKNAQLIKMNFELDRFVYSVSHDLRSPLSSLLGLIQITESKISQEDKKQIERLEMMRASVKKLDGFIGDILDYSRNARMLVSKDPVDFNILLEEELNKLKYMQGSSEVEIKKYINSDTPYFGDYKRLSIIIGNLISNSIKYRDKKKGTKIITITINTHVKMADITIADNGIGIEQGEIDKVFDMFYRATNQGTGSGLGMYIVKETLEKLNGKIKIVSELGSGTQVFLQIPQM